MTTAPLTEGPAPARPAGPASGAARRPGRPVGTLGLALAHTRWALVEQFRIPMAWIGSIVFPVLAFCFFVLPMAEVRDHPQYATEAMFSMLVFAFMANGLFSFGLEIAAQRAKPWAPYLRTLPGPAAARVIGLIASTLVSAIIAMLPVLVVGLVFTAAEPTPLRLAAGILVVIVTAIPSALIGLIIGSTCSEKAAIAVTQVVMFTMAFASGLFMPPMMFPEWLEVATRVLPVRAARDLAIAVATDGPIEWWTLVSIAAWTLVLAVVGVWLYRRDEGRRFR